jgi:hypothetical protein
MNETIALPEQGLILPAGVVKQTPKVDEEYEMMPNKKQKQCLCPPGLRLLCALIEAGDTFESGLANADETKKVEELTSPVFVCY